MSNTDVGSDAQIHDAAPAKPLESLAAREEAISAEPGTAARLRAFEDRVFGADYPRINDQIERGVGSRFSNLDDNQKAYHAALEALITAEQEHQTAVGGADVAAAKLEAARLAAAETEEAL